MVSFPVTSSVIVLLTRGPSAIGELLVEVQILPMFVNSAMKNTYLTI